LTLKNNEETIVVKTEKSSPTWSLVGFVVVIGTALCGVALGEIQSRYPSVNVTLIFAILALSISIVVYTFGQLLKAPILEHLTVLDDRVDAIKLTLSRQSLSGESSSESIFSQLEFIHFEQNFLGDEIWVISSSLENDDPGSGAYHHIVQANLARGVRYRYFFPKSEVVLGRVARMRASFNGNKNSIFWHPLTADFFRLHVGKNMGVYRHTNTGASDSAFVELKFDKTVRWAKLDDVLTTDIVGWLTKYTNPDLDSNDQDSTNL
jgi:hypothetical protein